MTTDAFRDWVISLTPPDVYDFDSEGRGHKKDRMHMMRTAWDAAVAAERERCASFCEETASEIDEGRSIAADIRAGKHWV